MARGVLLTCRAATVGTAYKYPLFCFPNACYMLFPLNNSRFNHHNNAWTTWRVFRLQASCEFPQRLFLTVQAPYYSTDPNLRSHLDTPAADLEDWTEFSRTFMLLEGNVVIVTEQKAHSHTHTTCQRAALQPLSYGCGCCVTRQDPLKPKLV
jgi:hypothetical protein